MRLIPPSGLAGSARPARTRGPPQLSGTDGKVLETTYDRPVNHDELLIEPVNDIELDQLVALYDAVGWSAYTRAPQVLRAAIAGSSYVVAARRGQRLVGVARAVSDDATICYLQDVLVLPQEQRSGVGRALVQAVLNRYRTVRQKVLLTDDEPGQRAFYEALGYTEVRDFGQGTLRAFVRFDG